MKKLFSYWLFQQARGSLSETLEHLICAQDEGFISLEELTKHKLLIEQCLRLLNGYIAYLKKAVSEKAK